jgi:uncharacterized protein YyaL (SSP411 family)
MRENAREAREERPRPQRDEKVLASWNGLTVSALAFGGIVLDERYGELAENALGFVRDTLWDGKNERLSRRYKDGEVKVDGYLDDYAFVARGALDLFGATSKPEHLHFALELGRVIVEEFQEDDGGALYYTPESGEKLVTRPRETTDTSTPASSGVAIDVLVALSAFDDYFEEPARRAVQTHVSDAESRPVGHESTVLAADRHTNPLEVVPADEHDEWRDALGETYAPSALVSPRPPTDGELEDWKDKIGLSASVPVWDGREARDEGTGYVCRCFTCSPPVEPEALGEWIERLSP